MKLSEIALEVSGLTKSFGPKTVLEDVSFTIRRGEVRGLLGQNGSGKSTIIKTLSGFHGCDSGTVTVGGASLETPVDSHLAKKAGLVFVHQDLALVPELTVMENLRLGEFTANRFGVVDWRHEEREARESLLLYGVDLDPSARVSSLSATDRALVAIVRALTASEHSAVNSVLVLDEPTVFLPPDGVERLFGAVRAATAKGAAALFVSHRMEEIMTFCDVVTVLRDGIIVKEAHVSEVDEKALVSAILGRDLSSYFPPALEDRALPVMAQVRNARGGRLGRADFDIRSGEILGVTGLTGAGWEDLPYVLFGASAVGGTITWEGSTLELAELDPKNAISKGIALLPADRPVKSGAPGASVRENVTLPLLKKYFSRGRLRFTEEKSDVGALLERYGVLPGDPEVRLSALSGGNQQKALLGKWLGTHPRLLLLHEPTQGVDVGARHVIFEILFHWASTGTAIVIASGEHEHLTNLCDRVLVFRDGMLSDCAQRPFGSPEALARLCYLNTDEPSRSTNRQ